MPDKKRVANFENDKSLTNAKNNAFKKFFGIEKYNTTLVKEMIAGISSFLAILYILNVEPNMLAGSNSIKGGTISSGSIFLATAIIMIVSSFIMGLVANVPLVLAPAMGINAVFVNQVANAKNGVGFEGACIATIISGILLLIISTSKLRVMIIKSIPKSLKVAITVGIGLMVAYLGLSNMHIFEMTDYGLPIAQLSDFSKYWPSVLIGLITLFACLIMYYRKIVGSTAITMFVVSIIVIILANCFNTSKLISNNFNNSIYNGWDYGGFKGFGTNIGHIFSEFGNINIWNKPVMYESILMLLILTFFDSTSTIDSACSVLFKNRKEEENKKVLVKAMVVDSASVVVSGVIGLSPNTVFAESFVAINQKSKTGISSITAAMLTGLAIPLFPLFNLIPSPVTGGAVAFVGIVIAYEFREIEWNKPEIQIAASLSILLTIVTINITNGVAIGIIAYCISCIALKKSKEVNVLMWCLCALFVAYFILYTLM